MESSPVLMGIHLSDLGLNLKENARFAQELLDLFAIESSKIGAQQEPTQNLEVT